MPDLVELHRLLESPERPMESADEDKSNTLVALDEKDIADQLPELADRCDALANGIETKLKNGP